MKTSIEALKIIAKAYDQLLDSKHKPLSPGDKEKVNRIIDQIEELTEQNGYTITYPNGKTPKLTPIK